MKDESSFIVSREDWSLHRKGYQDQNRHQEKVKEAIKKNLPDLVSEENIIMSNGREVIKIPIRSLDEYRLRFNFQKGKHGGQGKGNSKVGDVIARDGDPAQGPGKGQGAGDQPGVDYYEAEISVEELQEMLFAELELGITDDDLRFKTWEEIIKPHSNAVIVAMMGTSGSMGVFEKYIARSFFFWMVRFLRTKYEKVEIVFIAHHTDAKEVTEDTFFSKGESGGTICSSAYKKALEIIDSRYPTSQYNIYPFHFSDGDNLTSDNERCVKLVKELMERCNMFGYGEVNQYNRHSTLMSAYRHIKEPKFMHCVIREKGEVYKALRTFFGKKEAVK